MELAYSEKNKFFLEEIILEFSPEESPPEPSMDHLLHTGGIRLVISLVRLFISDRNRIK